MFIGLRTWLEPKEAAFAFGKCHTDKIAYLPNSVKHFVHDTPHFGKVFAKGGQGFSPHSSCLFFKYRG